MNSPRLAPAGAGLPWPQKWIVPFIAKQMMKASTWGENAARFPKLGNNILNLVGPLDEKAMETPILVPRLRGLEDSSRFWSVSMTLEHLIITSEAMADIMIKLSNGIASELVIDTAKVKPKKKFDAQEAKSEFKEMIQHLDQKLRSEIKDSNSSLRHPHPWFGPMSLNSWYWLIGSHLGIHRNQIKEIIKRLS